MRAARQKISRHTAMLIVYLVLSLGIGTLVTVSVDNYEDVTTAKEILRDEGQELTDAVRAFKVSSPGATSGQVMSFVTMFVSTGMSSELLVINPETDATPYSKDFRPLVSVVEGDKRMDVYMSNKYLNSQLSSYDVPDLMLGLFVTIAVFTVMVIYAEKKRQALVMQQRFEEKHAELTKALEEHEALALLGRMAATLAHELKTPISTISTLLQVFPSRSADENFRNRFVALAGEELNRTQQIIDNLLVYGKDIEIKDEQWTEFGPFIGEIAQKYGLKIAACPRFSLYGNVFYLGLLFENLIRNSRNAGAADIRVILDNPPAGDGVSAVVRIEDNGAGFPEGADLAKLMDPFVTERPNGAGLGLYLARKIAAAHGAAITPYRPQAGAGFMITLQGRRVRDA